MKLMFSSPLFHRHLNSLTVETKNPSYATSSGIDPYRYELRYRDQWVPGHPPHYSTSYGPQPQGPPHGAHPPNDPHVGV